MHSAAQGVQFSNLRVTETFLARSVFAGKYGSTSWGLFLSRCFSVNLPRNKGPTCQAGPAHVFVLMLVEFGSLPTLETPALRSCAEYGRCVATNTEVDAPGVKPGLTRTNTDFRLCLCRGNHIICVASVRKGIIGLVLEQTWNDAKSKRTRLISHTVWSHRKKFQQHSQDLISKFCQI